MKITFDIDTLTEKPEVLARLSSFLDYSGIATIGTSQEGESDATKKFEVASTSQADRVKAALASYGMELLPGKPNHLEYARLSRYTSVTTRTGLTYRAKKGLLGTPTTYAAKLPSKVYLTRHGKHIGYWVRHEDVSLWNNF